MTKKKIGLLQALTHFWMLFMYMNISCIIRNQSSDFQDGDGEITYEEFIEKVMPPEITHGGGGIMDFPCDDPAAQGSMQERLERLRKNVKKKLSTNSKNLREAFRKMGGAGDGKVDKYEFKTCLRNLGLGLGQPKVVDQLFHEIDDDNSGQLTFAEFSAGISHPRDATTDIKIERHIPKEFIQKKTIGSALMGGNPQETSRPNTPDEQDNSSDVARPETNSQIAPERPAQQRLRSREAQQRYRGWQRFKGQRTIPKVFARPKPKKTTAAQQRAADLRRSQGRYPVSIYARAASMRPRSAYIANRPNIATGKKQKRRPSSGRRLRIQKAQVSNTVSGAAGAYGPGSTVSPRMKKSHYFRSAPAAKMRMYQAKKNQTSHNARLAAQLQREIGYGGSRGLVSTGERKLDLSRLLGIQP